jgi:hypothetical protein
VLTDLLKIKRYQFFDQIVELHSDHANILSLMDRMFRRFTVTDNEGETLKYEVLTDVDGRPVITTKDLFYQVEQPARLSSLAYGIILRNTFARIRSHLLFHAGALSCRGKGIILAADSYCGKTTLTLALVRHGFKFLSDEVAALGLKNGELAPYPRCLVVREGTRQLFQQRDWELPAHQIAYKTNEKTAIHLSSALLGNNCQPHCLIIIQRPDEVDERTCEVTLDSLPDPLLTDLQAIVKKSVPDDEVEGLPVFKTKQTHIHQICEACDRQGVLVVNVEETPVAPNYYEKTPHLQELSKLKAALTLLPYFFGGYRSVLVQENDQGSAAGLIEPLVKILEPVKCYQLTPGKLEQTVEIINALC